VIDWLSAYFEFTMRWINKSTLAHNVIKARQSAILNDNEVLIDARVPERHIKVGRDLFGYRGGRVGRFRDSDNLYINCLVN